jgi:triacylglycerol esterase/lipase EstA (alpha/beta hydrolase family)
MRPKPKNKVVDSKPEDAYGWRLYNPAATHVFVFIHGLFSSAAACWTAKNKAFWPDLVSKDKRLSPAAVFCVEYHTRFSAGDYGIADCARSVMDQMSRPNEDESMRPIDFQEIIFVAHSMGGIICRYVLESNRHIFEPKKIGVVLMASPSTGSVYADLLSPINNKRVTKGYRYKVQRYCLRPKEMAENLRGRGSRAQRAVQRI